MAIKKSKIGGTKPKKRMVMRAQDCRSSHSCDDGFSCVHPFRCHNVHSE